MSDFNKYARINDKFNNDPLQGAEHNARKQQIYNRNASTFNPIGFDPNPQNTYDDSERRKQKEKQNTYKDQLDQMVQGNQGIQPYEKNPVESKSEQYARIEAEVRKELEKRYPQAVGGDDQRKAQRESEGTYAQEQYKRPADYERSQPQPGDYERDYGLQYQQPQESLPSYQQQQQQSPSYPPQYQAPPQYEQQQQAFHPHAPHRKMSPEKPQKAHHQEVDRYAQQAQEKHDTFEQQDYLREQLLSKIRTGYQQSNARVYNTYQQAYEQREKDMEEFERNVVDKAARDKILKDDYRAMVDFDKKKKLQRDALLSNQQAVESKMVQERKKKAFETATEKQNIQDSLYQFEKQNLQQKEAMRRLQQENAKVLDQQRQDFYTRKGDKGFNDVRPGQYVTGKRDSIDQLNYERRTPLQQPNPPRVGDSPPKNQAYGKNPYDRVTASMENLSLKQPYGQPDNYVPGYSQEPSYQPYGGRGKSQERVPYQYSQNTQNIPQYPQSSTLPQYPQSAQNIDYSAKTEYQKIRDRNRYGTNFNIISNEMT